LISINTDDSLEIRLETSVARSLENQITNKYVRHY